MKRISDAEILNAFRISHQDNLSGTQQNFWLTTHHALDCQLEADKKVMAELFEEIEKNSWIVEGIGCKRSMSDGCYQALKAKYLGE